MNATKRAWLAAILGFFPALAFAQVPPNAPIMATGVGTTSSVVATMPAKVGLTNWLCGIDISAAGSGALGPTTVSGLLTGSPVYQVQAGGAPVMPRFNPCIPASAPNTAITITTSADASATAVDVQAYGFASY